MNFKRKYPHNKKPVDEHGWSIPISLKKELDPVDIPKYHSTRKFPCKKLKGEHHFVLFKREHLSWWHTGKYFTEYRCSACNKKKVVFENESDLIGAIDQQKSPIYNHIAQ